MARLTDTQLIILSAASQREDRGVELPANVQLALSQFLTLYTTPVRHAAQLSGCGKLPANRCPSAIASRMVTARWSWRRSFLGLAFLCGEVLAQGWRDVLGAALDADAIGKPHQRGTQERVLVATSTGRRQTLQASGGSPASNVMMR